MTIILFTTNVLKNITILYVSIKNDLYFYKLTFLLITKSFLYNLPSALWEYRFQFFM